MKAPIKAPHWALALALLALAPQDQVLAESDDAQTIADADMDAAAQLSLEQWQARMETSARALHVARRVLWLAGSVFHPFDERVPPTTQPEQILTVKPVPGELSSPFGERQDPVKRKRRKHHKGVDFVAKRHTLVHAAGPGIVLRAQKSRSYGRIVIIDHGLGLQTRYAHLQKIEVKKGDFLPVGTVVGTVGSSGRATGPHLHFEVRQDGVALPPDDVTKFKLPPCAQDARDCVRATTPKS